MKSHILLFLSLFLVLIMVLVSLFTLTPLGRQSFATHHNRSSLTSSSASTPIAAPPISTPQPALMASGPAPTITASTAYLLDADTGHLLADINGEKPLPMASTTKIMTALIVIQTADLQQLVPIKQDAYDRVHIDGGSGANLIVGDQLSLKDLLYGLLLPSGDDAATAIADALGGTEAFVKRMNLFAYRLHLFQTHYTTTDGLTDDQTHYSTAYDLTQLAQYALHIPLFAQIVQTPEYTVAATAQHHSYDWRTTNTLLTTYSGTIGVKTGHTDAAGWCMVFAARRAGHELIGAILDSPSETQRDQDTTTLLNWGFSLALLPPIRSS
jgi:D-alanyl-D-alanine carboxypeptidase (penicillin-binding protein 5/6)